MNNAFFGGKGSDSYSLRAQKNWLTIPLKDGQRLLFINDIPQWACAFNRKVKKIMIDEGVEQIGEYAFYGCSNLEEIEISSDRLNINKITFAKCDKLRKIVFHKDFAYYKTKLFLNPKAFGFGKKDIVFQFKDRTINFNTEIAPDDSDGLSITALQEQTIERMLSSIRNNSLGTSFYIGLEDDYIKWADVIAVTYINDNEIRLSDEGFAFSTLDNKQFLRLKWANEIIKWLMRNELFDVELKDNCLCQTCTDIVHAAKCFLDLCSAVRLIGAYFYELDNLKVVVELIHEDIQIAAEKIFLENDKANCKEIVDMVGKKTLESYMHNDRMDFHIYFNLFDHLSSMSEQEMLKFKNEILNR